MRYDEIKCVGMSEEFNLSYCKLCVRAMNCACNCTYLDFRQKNDPLIKLRI